VFHAVAYDRVFDCYVVRNLIALIEHPDLKAIAGDNVARVWCESAG
jgi:hypothetical protein